MIAAQMKVVCPPAGHCIANVPGGQIARIKKSCRRCERMVQEPAPGRPIPGRMAGPDLLAHVPVSKFDDHLPMITFPCIARTKSSPAGGADIAESTLVGWCRRAIKPCRH